MNYNDINVSRNEEVRKRVLQFFEDFGVSKKFFAGQAKLDYGMFTKFLKERKNYADINLDKIENTLNGKFGQFEI